ncbi:MAG: DUF3109 family protein [Bacteroidota bacterium]
MMEWKRKKANLVQIGDILISTEIFDEAFICDLLKCKGACCVEGDLGAPLEKEELTILVNELEHIRPYLNQKGKAAIEEQGPYVYDFTGDYSTPLVEGKECAYTIFNEQGMALCGIEQAYAEGKTTFKKPISCHLYPIRVTKTRHLEALNYDRWDICSPACSKGSAMGVKVYEFLKGPLIRKYGEEFYGELCLLAEAYLAEPED